MVKETGQKEVSAQVGAVDADAFVALLKQSFMPRTEHAATEVENAVSTLVREALKDTSVIKSGVRDTIEGIITRIDRKLAAQINEILHATEFRRIESAWRGLNYLTSNSDTDADLKIRVLNVSKAELYRNLRLYSARWDQNPLFKQLYEYEFERLGCEPFGCLIGDYYFSHVPTDIQLLRDLGKVASVAHAPFVAGAESTLMGMESWLELSNPRDISDMFDAPEYAAWKELRGQDDSRYLGLCMPRVLGRLPYGARSEPIEEFVFEEDTGGYSGENYSWINTAYALAVNLNQSFKQSGWGGRISGAQSGGEAINLPIHTFPTDGGVTEKCPAEIAIDERNGQRLAELGLIPLIYCENTRKAEFIGAPSLHEPMKHSDRKGVDTAASDDLFAQLPTMFTLSHFAHSLKCKARDNIGSTTNVGELTARLQTWIDEYVDAHPTIPTELQTVIKSLAARIELIADEKMSSRYEVRLVLRLHVQADRMDDDLTLVFRLPAAKP
jgi:type VI secretion system protein ImpC